MSISILIVFEIFVLVGRLRVTEMRVNERKGEKDVRSFWWSTARKTGNSEAPLLILRPIMFRRRVVLLLSGYALGTTMCYPLRGYSRIVV